MIEQCFSNKNESATVSKSKKNLDLNKAYGMWIFSSAPVQPMAC